MSQRGEAGLSTSNRRRVTRRTRRWMPHGMSAWCLTRPAFNRFTGEAAPSGILEGAYLGARHTHAASADDAGQIVAKKLDRR